MKKNVLLPLILVLLLASLVHAESWDDYGDLDRVWDGQKTVTDKEFNEVVDALQEKAKKKENKKKFKLFKKISGGGTSLHNELNYDKDIQEIKPLKENDEGVLVNIPVNIILEGTVLEKGFYKVFAEKDKYGKIQISFFQSQFLKGKIEAVETEDDFEQPNIDFAEILPYNHSYVKMIFGSLDFNAYVFIPYKEE